MRNSTTRYVAVLLAALLFCLGAYPGQSSAQVPLNREPVPDELQRPAEGCIWEVPVVVIVYLPSGDLINMDVAKAPDYWNLGHMTLDRMRDRIQKIITATKNAREAGSRFRGYKNDQARPSIGIPVVALFTAYDLPPVSGKAKTIKGARPVSGLYTDSGADRCKAIRGKRGQGVLDVVDGCGPEFSRL